MFTDIEGSTGLLKRLGRERYGELLAEQQRLLRDVFAAYRGEEVDTQGDSFFVAFHSAHDAVSAAAAAERALEAHDWQNGAEVRVRIGIHTGEAAAASERYVGFSVHRAARIGAAAHGGQVLLSSTTRELVEDDLPDGIFLRDVGTYRLKDVDRPERISQLASEGLRLEFPPLRGAEPVKSLPLLRRRSLWAAVLAGVVAAAVAVPVFALGGGSGDSGAAASVDANALGLVSPASGSVSGQVQVGATPTDVAVGEGAIWVTNADDHTVSRIDLLKRVLVQTIGVGNSPSGIATGNGAVWVANSLDGTVSRVDPGTNTVVQTISVGNHPLGIAFGARAVWVANTGDDTVTRIAADSGRATKLFPIAATELAFGAGSLWASQRTANRVARIDPATGTVVSTIPVGNGPGGIAFGASAVWVANNLDGTVTRIDPGTHTVTNVIPTGDGPAGIAVDRHGVWVSNQFDGTLVQIDPRTDRVLRRISVGNRPQGVAAAGGTVLVAVRQSGAGHRGGTLTVEMSQGPNSVDSAVGYGTGWLFLRMVGDGLAAFNQTSGLEGTLLVPDLAVSLPTPTDGGRTYTFRLRPGIRYSTGRPVLASDVRATFERNLEIGPSQYYDGIVGAARCRKSPKQPCDLSRGIIVDDAARTVSFHLTAPDPEFLYKLALPFANVVSAGTPPRDVGAHPLPATGPYMIAAYRPGHLLRLVRNPHFHEWSKAAQPDGYPDEITVKIGGTVDRDMNDVIRDRADIFTSAFGPSPSRNLLAVAKTRYASQVRTNPRPALLALFLNTRIAPFDRIDVRRALNYAADRAAVVQFTGGPDLAQATCQILPPNFPGYQPYCPYTQSPTTRGRWTRPDLAKARALVAASGTRGMKITVWTYTEFLAYGSYAVKLLRSLGYRASMKVYRTDVAYFPVIGDSRTRAQIGYAGWIPDYPAPSGFFNPLFICASLQRNSPANTNWAGFCDPRIDAKITRALTEQATNPDAARKLWRQIDRQTVDEAPWVPLTNAKVVDVLSKRVGNYQYSAGWGTLLIDQLWVH